MTPTAALPPLTPATALSTWTLDPAAVAVALALLAAQLLLVARVRSRGLPWPWWRTATGAVLGPGALLLATCSWTTAYRQVALWPGALAATVLLVVVPAGIAFGDPVRLLRLARTGGGAPHARPARTGAGSGTRTSTGRVVATSALGALAGVAVQLALYLTPWWAATLRSGTARSATGLLLVAVGSLFAVPVLGSGGGADDAGSGASAGAWGLRVLLTFLDGVVDAVPGLVVGVSGAAVAGGWYDVHRLPGSMAAGTDQLLAGTLAVTVGEVVTVPLLLVACRRWARADAVQAAREDALLDAQERGALERDA